MNIVPMPPRVNDIPAMLRKLADDIQANTYGEALECAVVLNAAKIEVFAFGAANGTTTYYLFGCGMRRLESGAKIG